MGRLLIACLHLQAMIDVIGHLLLVGEQSLRVGILLQCFQVIYLLVYLASLLDAIVSLQVLVLGGRSLITTLYPVVYGAALNLSLLQRGQVRLDGRWLRVLLGE